MQVDVQQPENANLDVVPDARAHPQFPGIEVLLIRTLPRKKKYHKLRATITNPTRNWKAFGEEDCPFAALFSQKFFGLCERPPHVANEMKILGVAFEQAVGKNSLVVTRAQAWSKPGVIWEGVWPENGSLGKRSRGPTQEIPLQHKLKLSRFGVGVSCPPSATLDSFLHNQLTKLPMLLDQISDHQFKISVDDITGLWELRIYSDNIDQPVKLAVYRYSKKFTHFDDPELLIIESVCKLLETAHMDSYESFWHVLHRISQALLRWTSLYTELKMVPEAVNMEEFVTPFLVFQKWAKAICRYFYKPILQSTKDIVTGPNPHPSCEKAYFEPRAKQLFYDSEVAALEFFADIDKMDQVIANLRATLELGEIIGFAKNLVKSYETILGPVDYQLHEVIVSLLGIPVAYERIRSAIYSEIYGQDQHRKCMEMPEDFKDTDIPFTPDELNCFTDTVLQPLRVWIDQKREHDIIRSLGYDWMFARTLNKKKLMADSSNEGYPTRLEKIIRAVNHMDHTMLFVERDRLVVEQEICLINPDMHCRSFQYPDDWLRLELEVSRYFTDPPLWHAGTMLRIGQRLKNQFFVFWIDFRPCIHNHHLQPDFVMRRFNKFRLEPDDRTMIRGNSWAYINQALFLLTYDPFLIPKLRIMWISNSGVKGPSQYVWSNYFTADEMSKMFKFRKNGKLHGMMNMIASDKKRVLYISTIQPERTNCPPLVNKNHHLHIGCFKINRPSKSLTFLTKQHFLISTDLLPQCINPRKEFISKFLTVRKQEYLVLSGDPMVYLLFGLIKSRLTMITVNKAKFLYLPENWHRPLCLRGLQTVHFDRYWFGLSSFPFEPATRLKIYHYKVW